MEKYKRLKAVDFFCGAGGMTLGLSWAGIEVLAGIDIDEGCKDTYEVNTRGSKFILKDIRRLKKKELGDVVGMDKGDDCLVFVGCNPCQYWTQLNTDKTKSEETRDLLREFQGFVQYFMPGFVVVENVRGFLSNKDESGLSNLLNFLDKCEYKRDYGVVNAARYDVPQNRKRFLLVASRVRNEIGLPKEVAGPVKTVRQFIGVWNGFGKIGAGNVDKTDMIHTTAKLSEKNLKRLEMTPCDGGTRIAWKDNLDLQIPTYKDKDDTFRDTYGRMFWDKPAPTITTKFYSISNGRFAHPEENRGLSLREGATLQTFPRTYIFKGSGITSIAKQIGNAVPPELAKRIGLSLING